MELKKWFRNLSIVAIYLIVIFYTLLIIANFLIPLLFGIDSLGILSSKNENMMILSLYLIIFMFSIRIVNLVFIKKLIQHIWWINFIEIMAILIIVVILYLVTKTFASLYFQILAIDVISYLLILLSTRLLKIKL